MKLPDAPVLVMSGDLDSNTPIEQGRRVAAQFRRPTFAVVANSGRRHTTRVSGRVGGRHVALRVRR